MLEALPLLATTGIFVSVLVHIFAKLQLENVRANWNERRCEPLVTLVAQMVPTDPAVDKSKFSVDNFNFCMSKLIDASIGLAMKPVLSIFNTQLTATGPIQDSMNNLKTSASTLIMGPITQLFNFMWTKMSQILYQILRIFIKLHSAFDRIFGIAISSLFGGISMYKAIQNAIGFVIKVCIIILIILVVLVIFLFFVLFPVIPVILTTISIIAATAYGASVGGMEDSFCVAPGTFVATFNGWKPVEQLVCGEDLDAGVIEGILKVTGKGASVVNIHGVVLSGSHLLYDSMKKQWISASNHPDAVPCATPRFLYCLNTSNHTWRVKTIHDSLILRDWEELPNEYSDKLDVEWERLVASMLNIHPFTWKSSTGRGLLGADTYVWAKKGRILIEDIAIGDYIQCGVNEYTEVLGVYKDTSERQPSSGPNPAIWCFYPNNSMWAHPFRSYPSISSTGYHLVTKSGTFFIDVYTASPLLIRDFTEVGWDRIHETYAFVLSHLNVRNDEACDVSC
jgi:hypothetical protein